MGLGSERRRSGNKEQMVLPLVIYVSCVEDCSLEQEALADIARVQTMGMLEAVPSKLQSAAVVVVQCLSFLPRSVQRRLHPSQLIICLGSPEKAVDSGLADVLGLQLVHVDKKRCEELADTTMTLVLNLLRRSHELLSRRTQCFNALGQSRPLSGMRRLQGMVMGLVGTDGAAKAVAQRAAGFGMRIVYVVVDKNGVVVPSSADRHGIHSAPSHHASPQHQIPDAQRLNSLVELVAGSDVVSLHLHVTQVTAHIINDAILHATKPGCYLVNTSSCHLLDDRAVKHALIRGTLGGTALDGVDGMEWQEAWVQEMPNVLISPRSADYSDDVLAEMRAKAVAAVRFFLLYGAVEADAWNEEDDEAEAASSEVGERSAGGMPNEFRQDWTDGGVESEDDGKVMDEQQPLRSLQPEKRWPQEEVQSPAAGSGGHGCEEQRGPRGAEGGAAGGVGLHRRRKKGGGRSKGCEDGQGSDGGRTSLETSPGGNKDGGRHGGGDEVPGYGDPGPLNGGRHGGGECPDYGGPEDGSQSLETQNVNDQRAQQGGDASGSRYPAVGRSIPSNLGGRHTDVSALEDGMVVLLRDVASRNLWVAGRRGPGRCWTLRFGTLTVRDWDPSAQFVVVMRGKDRLGFRSAVADGKLLQVNKKHELGFINHGLDAWECWGVMGEHLSSCRLTHRKFHSVSLGVSIEVIAGSSVDGVVRFIAAEQAWT